MSEAWDCMPAYQKLTDGVLDHIMMSDDDKLQPSKDLLSRIHNRDLYKCVYESLPRKVTQDSSKQEKEVNDKIIEAGKDLHVHLSEKDFMVKVSHFLPSVVFQEEIIRVYLKTSDKETALRKAIKEAKIEEWLR